MAYPYRSPGPAPQLGGSGPVPSSFSSNAGAAGLGGGNPYGLAPPSYVYDQSRVAAPDPYGPQYGTGGYAGAGVAPSYCQMQDYLNGGGHALGGGGMYRPRSATSPMRWSQPQHAADGLYGRGQPQHSADALYGRGSLPADPRLGHADPRSLGHAAPSPYAWHNSPPTPPRERIGTEAPVGLPVQPEGSWEILTEENGWQPWLPGVDFYGYPGEELHFRLGAFSYFVVFDSAASGTQANLITGIRRPVRRRIHPGLGQEGFESNLQQDRGIPMMPPPEDDRGLPRRLHPQHVEQQPSRSMPPASPGDVDGMDTAAAYDLASEAYRELQKLGQGRTAPEQPEVPEVIALGNVPYDAPNATQWGSPDLVSDPASPDVTAATEPDAFILLEDLQVQQQALENKVFVILEALEEEAVTPGQAKDKLAQIEARLSKLQCNGIDSVSTAGLEPERADEARAMRKELTKKAENLQSRLDKIFADIKSMSSK